MCNETNSSLDNDEELAIACEILDESNIYSDNYPPKSVYNLYPDHIEKAVSDGTLSPVEAQQLLDSL